MYRYIVVQEKSDENFVFLFILIVSDWKMNLMLNLQKDS